MKLNEVKCERIQQPDSETHYKKRKLLVEHLFIGLGLMNPLEVELQVVWIFVILPIHR